MEESPTLHTFWVFARKCYILKKGTRLSKFEKKCDEGFCLDTQQGLQSLKFASGTLEEVHDVEFDETKCFQEEDENLDDV